MMKWIYRMAPFIFLGAVWIQSDLFNPQAAVSEPAFGHILELGHLVLFAILYILVIGALRTFGRITLKREMHAVIFCFICAIVDEIHQHYVSFRSFSLIDLWKDGIGIIAAWYMIHLWCRLRELQKIL